MFGMMVEYGFCIYYRIASKQKFLIYLFPAKLHLASLLAGILDAFRKKGLNFFKTIFGTISATSVQKIMQKLKLLVIFALVSAEKMKRKYSFLYRPLIYV